MINFDHRINTEVQLINSFPKNHLDAVKGGGVRTIQEGVLEYDFNPADSILYLSEGHLMCYGLFSIDDLSCFRFTHLYPGNLTENIFTLKNNRSYFCFSQQSIYDYSSFGYEQKFFLDHYNQESLDHLIPAVTELKHFYMIDVRLPVEGRGFYAISFGDSNVVIWNQIQIQGHKSILTPVRAFSLQSLLDLVSP
jgi:hypothetical protein